VQAHPDEKQMGRLGMMVGTKIPVTITPPESAEDLVGDDTIPEKPPVLRERTREGDVVA
jgi:hypothetical protein